MPISQNGQTHTNNSSARADEMFECVWPFCGVGTSRVKKETIRDIVQKSYCGNLELEGKKTIFRKLLYTNVGQSLDGDSQGQFLLEIVRNLLKVDNKDTKKTCKKSSTLTEKLLGRRFKCLSCKLWQVSFLVLVSVIDFDYIELSILIDYVFGVRSPTFDRTV